ncbi:MAG: homoserine dehydrogenase [Clostridia bacterium]|nr:homoserine dehydrogenase [Clostridia bacterium]
MDQGKIVRLGFLGCGNIGGGVYHLLTDMHDEILRRDGLDIQIARALVKSIPEARTDVPAALLTESADDVLCDPSIDVVCEFMGGEHPAADFMEKALLCGKSVVTANKMALALNWHRLQTAADRTGAGLYYEASVGGVIPIIRSLTVSLEADEVDLVMGIVNGTTNYILTKMAQDGSSYGNVLREAQKLGLAEPDPTADVEGYDAAYKLSILSSIAFHTHVPLKSVYREGITAITADDIAYGREMGYTLKLLAIGKKKGNELEVRVHPTFLPASHPLSRVDGSLNAIFVHGKYCQDLTLQGRGAGDKPTASAICGDILYAATHKGCHTVPSFRNIEGASPEISFVENWQSRYFVRLDAADTPGVLSAVAQAFAERQISISSILQRPSEDGRAQIMLVTHEAKEKSVQAALAALDPASVKAQSVIRVES